MNIDRQHLLLLALVGIHTASLRLIPQTRESEWFHITTTLEGGHVTDLILSHRIDNCI